MYTSQIFKLSSNCPDTVIFFTELPVRPISDSFKNGRKKRKKRTKPSEDATPTFS
jgi:hypothetical protein